MRCWGRSTPQADARGLQFERPTARWTAASSSAAPLLTGYLIVRHEAYDGGKLGTLRFAERYSTSFRNEPFGVGDRQLHRAAAASSDNVERRRACRCAR